MEIILPLAMSSFSLGGLAEELLEREYPAYVERFNRVKERFGVGWQVLRDAFFRDEPPSDLTAREREIAGLAAKGLHNGEIASRLFVSENTVRAHMRTIFQKLDIDRRAKLAEKLGVGSDLIVNRGEQACFSFSCRAIVRGNLNWIF